MVQLNQISALLTVNDYKIYGILIVSVIGIFLLNLISEKAFSISSEYSLTNQDNVNLLYVVIT